jgi:hypothetical protein
VQCGLVARLLQQLLLLLLLLLLLARGWVGLVDHLPVVADLHLSEAFVHGHVACSSASMSVAIGKPAVWCSIMHMIVLMMHPVSWCAEVRPTESCLPCFCSIWQIVGSLQCWLRETHDC